MPDGLRPCNACGRQYLGSVSDASRLCPRCKAKLLADGQLRLRALDRTTEVRGYTGTLRQEQVRSVQRALAKQGPLGFEYRGQMYDDGAALHKDVAPLPGVWVWRGLCMAMGAMLLVLQLLTGFDQPALVILAAALVGLPAVLRLDHQQQHGEARRLKGLQADLKAIQQADPTERMLSSARELYATGPLPLEDYEAIVAHVLAYEHSPSRLRLQWPPEQRRWITRLDPGWFTTRREFPSHTMLFPPQDGVMPADPGGLETEREWK